MNQLTEQIYQHVCQLDPDQKEFQQAVYTFLLSMDKIVDELPEVTYHKVIERMVEPERAIIFRVPWMDDEGRLQINRGFRVQQSSALGPYKGGLRFHPSVNLSIMKFLAFEQVFKNSLTGLPMGGGKGGSDFNPKGKSDAEVMRFCQSFMNVLTGKGQSFGGSLIRPEATGYGLVYFCNEILAGEGRKLEGSTCLVSGSGNVAQFTVEKLNAFGAKVVTLSDSSGMIYDEEGITPEKLAYVKQLKNVKRGRISEYAEKYKGVTYIPRTGNGANPIWDIKADYAFPCATQNEINAEDAANLVKNGIRLVGEGANMPCAAEAERLFLDKGVLLAPSKAANAGGVAVSGLEMSQNSMRLKWTSQEVDQKLQGIMKGIYESAKSAADRYSEHNNFVDGANIAGFLKVADAMIAQGYV